MKTVIAELENIKNDLHQLILKLKEPLKKPAIIGVAIANELRPVDTYNPNKEISFTYALKPSRHSDVIEIMAENNIKSTGKIHGFIDQDYKFMTRKEAYSFALKHDLIINPCRSHYQSNILVSDDLW